MNNTSAVARAELGQSTDELKQAMTALFLAAAPGLERVEARIRSRLRSDAPQLAEISEYLRALGGKRVRPVFALTAGRMFGLHSPSDELVTAAAGIELIHMATLLHDDIIDASPVRRHQESAFKRFGMAPSLLAGDFLLARAFGLCAHLDLFVIESTEQASVELTEGENLEGTIGRGERPTFEAYLNVVRKKTASLFGLAAAVGTHIAGSGRETVARMKEFGYLAGTVFQMVDDILDITADEDLLGKPSGTDLRQKTPSLVNILWLASGDKNAKDFFARERPSETEARSATSYLKESGIVDNAKKIASKHAAQATELLSSVQEPTLVEGVRSELNYLVEYTLSRCA